MDEVNAARYLNVAKAAKQERKLNYFFHRVVFMIENRSSDGFVPISNDRGCIYNIWRGKKKRNTILILST